MTEHTNYGRREGPVRRRHSHTAQHGTNITQSRTAMEPRYTTRGLVTSALFVVGLLAVMFVPTVALGAVLGVAGLKMIQRMRKRARGTFRRDGVSTSAGERRQAA